MQFGRNNTPFGDAEFADRLARTRRRMADSGVEALILCDPANMNYLTGYDGWSFYVHQAVVVAQDWPRPLWFGRGQDVNGARLTTVLPDDDIVGYSDDHVQSTTRHRSEEHTSELQSLMRISYAVFCLKKKKKHQRRKS